VARSLRDTRLDTREARAKLKARGKPYWRMIEPGLHLGYRRLKGRPGSWCVRRYVGAQTYGVEALGAVADDYAEADGTTVMDFRQAQRAVMTHKPKGAGPLTVRQAMEAYLEFLESNRKSAEDAKYRAEALILPKLGDIEVTALTADHIRKWLISVAKMPPRLRTAPGEKQRHRELSADDESRRKRRATANRTLTILKAALNRAWREGKVASNSEWHRVEPFENVDAARVRYLSVAEAKRLLNACAPDFRRLVQAGLQTGARYGELTALRVHDFNPDAGTVAIRQSKGGSSRHVVLTDEGAAFFKQICAGRPGNEIMLRKDNGAPWLKSHQKRPMLDACERAKVDPPIGFHGLRHTWASLAVMAGVPLLVVAKNLGHSDTRMVEKHYGHLAPSYIADAIRAGAPRFGLQPDSNVTMLAGR